MHDADSPEGLFPEDLAASAQTDDAVRIFSEDAEFSLLCGLMLDNTQLDRIGDLDPGDFFVPGCADVFRAIRSLAAKGRGADVVTVSEHLGWVGDEFAWLVQLSGHNCSTQRLADYAAIVRDKSVRRSLVQAVGRARAIAAGQLRNDDAMDAIATLLEGVRRRVVTGRAVQPLGEVMVERTDHYSAVEAGTVPLGMPTGLPYLDTMLGGGLRPGHVYIVAARPSVGKSSFTQQLALNLSDAGYPALLLSQEMPASEVADRAVSNLGRLPMGSIRPGRAVDSDAWGRITEAAEKALSMPIFVCDQGGLTLTAIKAKAREVKGLKVLVIDYLQLCAGDTRTGANRNAELEVISRGLKHMAKDMGIAVVALSQLNRKVEERASKEPGLGDLRDSGAIEQDADVVLMLWPVRENEDGSRLVGIKAEKNRQGRIGRYGLHFQGALQRWDDSTESLDAKRMGGGRARGFEG